MSNEEREALEILKGFEPDDLVECAIYLQAMEKITNLIEKQSKEIEDNKKYIVQLTDEQYRKLVDIIRTEISKEWEDKIKAIIEELQEDIKYSANPLSIDNSKFAIKVLQSLSE